jgi:hypothetical protein
VLFIGTRCHPRDLRALGHPGIADLGRQMDVQFIGKDYSLRALELFKGHPEAGQTLDAAGDRRLWRPGWGVATPSRPHGPIAARSPRRLSGDVCPAGAGLA